MSTSSCVPEIDEDGAEWWACLAQGELRLPHCDTCGKTSFPPTAGCPHCGAPRTGSVATSGRGRLYSWVTIHLPLDPEFAAEVPYTVVAVDLEEGARIVGRLLEGSERARLSADAPVRAEIYWVDGQALLGFRLAD